MTTRRKNNLRPLMASHVALTVLVCGAAAFGEAGAASSREQRLKEIAGKSESERARLQRSFKTFRDLPPAEQENLRRLDRELKEDTRAGGNLRSVMDDYYNWLATLTPGQQQDLRAITDPTRREIRAREFLKEQQEQAFAGGAARGNKTPPHLGTKDLAAVLGVIEEAMREKHLLSADDVLELQRKKDLARHMYLWGGLAFRTRTAGPPQGQLPWMSKEVIDAMVDAISNEKIAAQVRAGQGMDRWWRLVRVIFNGIRAEYDSKRPDQETLERFFVQLNSEKQDEIMRLPFDQQPQQLMHMYMNKMSEDDPDNYPKLPQFPNWARGNRAALRAGMRGGDGQRGGESGDGRANNEPGRKYMKNRQKAQSADPE
jgi:hypothetical protein